MNNSELISKTSSFVKSTMKGESSDHDWWHVYRVWQTAKSIADTEPTADRLVVELAALLHDIEDWKFAGPEAGPKAIREWLNKLSLDELLINKIVSIVRGEISQDGKVLDEAKSMIEYKIVHDADNIDAIGAIGIARAFATGARFNEAFYDPNISAPHPKSTKEYIETRGKSGRTTINHFYEKLLKIVDLIETEKGKTIAAQRNEYMEGYLYEFNKEWSNEV